mmetsp:Transcript_33910/g.88974  ORF Transcript_33910/g.88974 Transcript_33910/m.88974 type:complete len:258 (-) Transcript_33910:224-997(-)
MLWPRQCRQPPGTAVPRVPLCFANGSGLEVFLEFFVVLHVAPEDVFARAQNTLEAVPVESGTCGGFGGRHGGCPRLVSDESNLAEEVRLGQRVDGLRGAILVDRHGALTVEYNVEFGPFFALSNNVLALSILNRLQCVRHLRPLVPIKILDDLHVGKSNLIHLAVLEHRGHQDGAVGIAVNAVESAVRRGHDARSPWGAVDECQLAERIARIVGVHLLLIHKDIGLSKPQNVKIITGITLHDDAVATRGVGLEHAIN